MGFRKFCLLALLFVFLSGCVNYPIYKGEFVSYTEVKTNDLEYAIDLYPSELSSDETLKVRIKITPLKDLKDVKIEVLDPCILIAKTKEKEVGDIAANTQKIIDFDFETPSKIEIATQCKIKFKITYQGKFHSVQDIVVLSSGEYEERALSGTLDEIKISSTKTPSAVEVEVSFSETEPFRDGKEMYMYIDYFNRGEGISEPLTDVVLSIPSNLEVKDCNDYTFSQGKLSLSEKITFYQNQAKRSVCEVETKANSPVDIQKLSVEAKYKYMIEDYIIVEVVP